ncbi:MAG: hypothetical protein ACK5N9_06780, partial [Pirellula sp.]
GDFLRQRGQSGDAESALRHYERGLKLSEDLLAANPGSAQALRDVSLSLERLGDFLRQRGQSGDAESALRHYERGLKLREDLLAANPDSAQALRDVWISLWRLAQISEPADPPKAKIFWTRARDILDGMLSKGMFLAAGDLAFLDIIRTKTN